MAPLTLGVSLDQAVGVATIFGVAGAAVALWFGATQLRIARSIAKGDFLLRLEDAMEAHAALQDRLHRGAWRAGAPAIAREDRAKLQDYLGEFELIELLVDAGVVDLATIDRLHGYRLDLLLWNEQAHGMAAGNPKGWAHYLALQASIDALHKRGRGRGRRIDRVRRRAGGGTAR
jgi:hypothetical protein